MRLGLIGFGSVGQGLAQILAEKHAQLRAQYGVDLQICAVITRSRGALFHPAGLDPAALLAAMGFDIGHSSTPIIPLMLGDAHLAQQFSRALLENGVFAMAIGFPTVAQGAARIRVMNTAAHSQSDLEEALEAFSTVGRALGVIV